MRKYNSNKRTVVLPFVTFVALACAAYLATGEIRGANVSHVVISEVQTSGGTGKTTNDFIELYNPTDSNFDLNGYRLIKRTANSTSDVPIKAWTAATTIKPHGYYLWANSGYTELIPNADVTTSDSIADDNGIALRFGAENTGEIIDSVAWGTVSNGLGEGTLLANLTPNTSIERKPGGTEGNAQDTDNNSVDFIAQTTPNPQNSSAAAAPPLNSNTNSINTNSNSNDNTNTAPSYSNQVVINELLPDPVGDDKLGEFIELINLGNEPVDLAGWKLKDLSGAVYTHTLSSNGGTTMIVGKGFFDVPRTRSSIILNNDDEGVVLLAPDGSERSKIEFQGNATEGSAWARKDDGTWAWTTTPTQGAANVFTSKNRPPSALFSISGSFAAGSSMTFDASDSSDPDGDSLTFSWNFGDGSKGDGFQVTHEFRSPGAMTVTLTVDDEKEKSTHQEKITIFAPLASNAASTPGAFAVILSEFLPNPLGSDEGEWIELSNRGERIADVSGWRLDDGEGGSGGYTLPHGTMVGAFGYLVIPKSDSRISLNNTADTVRLFNSAGQLVSSISYSDPPEGKSYALMDNGSWQWTQSPTRGQANRDDRVVSGTTEAGAALIPGTRATVQGIVSVSSDVLGKNLFYLAEPALQVYLNEGSSLSTVSRGDLVKVTGIVRAVTEGLRIALSSPEDLQVLGHGRDPEPRSVTAKDFTDSLLGALVRVSGTVLEKGSGEMTLDDGTGEIRTVLKSEADKILQSVEVGGHAEVTGILGKTTKGYRLLPRDAQDVSPSEVLGAKTSSGGVVPGTIKNGRNTPWLPIAISLGIGFGITLAVLGVIALRRRNELALEEILDLNVSQGERGSDEHG